MRRRRSFVVLRHLVSRASNDATDLVKFALQLHRWARQLQMLLHVRRRYQRAASRGARATNLHAHLLVTKRASLAHERLTIRARHRSRVLAHLLSMSRQRVSFHHRRTASRVFIRIRLIDDAAQNFLHRTNLFVPRHRVGVRHRRPAPVPTRHRFMLAHVRVIPRVHRAPHPITPRVRAPPRGVRALLPMSLQRPPRALRRARPRQPPSRVPLRESANHNLKIALLRVSRQICEPHDRPAASIAESSMIERRAPVRARVVPSPRVRAVRAQVGDFKHQRLVRDVILLRRRASAHRARTALCDRFARARRAQRVSARRATRFSQHVFARGTHRRIGRSRREHHALARRGDVDDAVALDGDRAEHHRGAARRSRRERVSGGWSAAAARFEAAARGRSIQS